MIFSIVGKVTLNYNLIDNDCQFNISLSKRMRYFDPGRQMILIIITIKGY